MRPMRMAWWASCGSVAANVGKLEFDKAESPDVDRQEPEETSGLEVYFLQERDQSLRLVGREFTAYIFF